MKTQTPRRRSKLSESNPLGNTVPPGEAVAPVEPIETHEATQTGKTVKTEEAVTTVETGKMVEAADAPCQPQQFDRMTLSFPLELGSKIRGALMVDGFPRGVTSLSEWVSEAMEGVISELEESRGQIPMIRAGRVPRGHNALRREG